MDKKADTTERIAAMERVHRRLFRMEAERDAKEAAAHCDAGDAFTQQQDYDNAIREYTAAIMLSSNAVYYANRGNAYFKTESWGDALVDYCEALNTEPLNKAYRDGVSACFGKMTVQEIGRAAVEHPHPVFQYVPEDIKKEVQAIWESSKHRI
ncbi:hypothetical protein AGMMS49944_12090 [Spirochaetia bacterium]|nr:hypothetical protein AGMMS49944_12090 [Spirochaetia bacterium]